MRAVILFSAIVIAKSVNESIVNEDKGILGILTLAFLAWDVADYFIDKN